MPLLLKERAVLICFLCLHFHGCAFPRGEKCRFIFGNERPYSASAAHDLVLDLSALDMEDQLLCKQPLVHPDVMVHRDSSSSREEVSPNFARELMLWCAAFLHGCQLGRCEGCQGGAGHPLFYKQQSILLPHSPRPPLCASYRY